MTYVVTQRCAGGPLPRCVIACPTRAFRRDETMYYIHPDGCVDCDACVGACPAGAIYDELELPEHLLVWREINARQARQLPEVVLELA